jgi:hypothetical protein
MKLLFAILFACCCLTGGAPLMAQEPVVSNRQPLPSVQPVVLPNAVPVPETIGATLLAGVGFLLIFRRRRYS